MINYRNIFNPSYNYIGLLLIGIIIYLLFITIKDLKKSLNQIGKTSIVSGTISLVIILLINFIINQILPYQYKIFIQVISKNVYKTALIYSIVVIILGIFLLTIEKILKSENKKV